MSNEVEHERHRLAQRLEHEIIPLLTLMLSQVQAYRSAFSTYPPVQDSMSVLNSLTGQVLTKVRDLQANLSPTTLENLGVGTALEALAAQIHRTHGAFIRLDVQRLDTRFAPQIELALYRSAQALVEDALEQHIPQMAISLQHQHDVVHFSFFP